MDAISSLRTESGIGVQFSGISPKTNHGSSGFCQFSQENKSKSKLFPVMSLQLKEHPMASATSSSVATTPSISVSRRLKWWENSTKQNMLEVSSANQLVETLLNAGDKLVVLDFYSPFCGGCKSLHPKICQIAESNPNVMFLKVNQEELRTMCHGLNVHVLPFFKFYRGSEGKVCSFSCTISTINKFKKALDKHGSERCSLGPAKGLDEKELEALASVGELNLNLNLKDNNFGYQTKEEQLKNMIFH